jgi:hypothetical protein
MLYAILNFRSNLSPSAREASIKSEYSSSDHAYQYTSSAEDVMASLTQRASDFPTSSVTTEIRQTLYPQEDIEKAADGRQ